MGNRPKRRNWRWWGAMAAVFCAQPLSARHLPVQLYTSAQGLPRNLVSCMLPGSNGFLWLCTNEGLARFDGYHFRVFGPEQGLPSRSIVFMAAARAGGYWVLTEEGLCRLAPGSKIGEPCRLLETDGKTAPFYKGIIFESARGTTWVSNSNVLYAVDPSGRRLERASFKATKGQSILSMADTADGALLIGTNLALYDWKPGEDGHNLAESLGPMGILCLFRWSETEYWAGTNIAGLLRIRRENGRYNVRSETVAGMMPAFTAINSIVQRRDGTVWAGGNGITRLETDPRGEFRAAERYTTADGLPSNAVDKLVEDAQGNLWATTDGSGVLRIEAAGFISYSSEDGLGSGRVASILEDRHGRICVQTSWHEDPNILVQDGEKFRSVPIRHPNWIHYFGWGWNQFVLAARDGSWWIPTGSGMLRFPKLERTEDLAHVEPVLLDDRSGLGCREIFRTWEDRAGDVWVTCLSPDEVLVRWQRRTGRYQRYTEADGLPRDTVPIVFREGTPGTLWMAAENYLMRFRGERLESFPLAAGKRSPGVRDLLVDSGGRVWVATEYGGLFRCDNPNAGAPLFHTYTVAEGLSTDFVSSLVEDAAGYIYAGTARGVDRIDPRAPVGSQRIRHFTAADGLPESEENTAMRDSRGHLWFGTLAGLAEFDPGKWAHRAPPEIYLTRVRVRGEDIPLPWQGTRALALQLAADRNQVEVEYSAIDLSSPESLLYQYRLGADHDWSEPAQQLDVNYASLPAGTFRFEVRAVDAEGQASVQPAGFDLRVAAPLWRRWWFLSGTAVLAMGTLLLLYDYRVRHLLAMERLRTRIATDLHDDIGASLTQISILSELARRGAAPQVLSDIANIARGLVSDMSDIVWAVNPRHDRFEGLVHRMRRFANDVLGGADIDVDFETAGLPADVAVPLDSRRPLYLVLKEAVNNVARHSGAKRAVIRLELEAGDLRLTVSDDGRGFDVARPQTGEGLPSMARRMKEIGGTVTWETAPGAGTRFTAVLPLRGRTALHELVARSTRIRR